MKLGDESVNDFEVAFFGGHVSVGIEVGGFS